MGDRRQHGSNISVHTHQGLSPYPCFSPPPALPSRPPSPPARQASTAAGIKLPACIFPISCVYIAPVIVSYICAVPVRVVFEEASGCCRGVGLPELGGFRGAGCR